MRSCEPSIAGWTRRTSGADVVDESAEAVIGRTLDLDDAFVREALDPGAFVEAHDIDGGPAPREVRRMIQDRRANRDEDRVAMNRRRERLDAASETLSERVDELVEAV